MPEARHPHVNDTFYYVFLSCLPRYMLFALKNDYTGFLSLLGRTAPRLGIRVLTYYLDPQECRLVVKIGRRSLDDLMKILIGSLREQISTRIRRPLPDDALLPYKAVIIQRDGYLLRAVRYVHSRGKARCPHEISSDRCYRGMVDTPWLHKQAVFECLSRSRRRGSVDSPALAYDKYMRRAVPQAELEIFQACESGLVQVVGGPGFLPHIKNRLQVRRPRNLERMLQRCRQAHPELSSGSAVPLWPIVPASVVEAMTRENAATHQDSAPVVDEARAADFSPSPLQPSMTEPGASSFNSR